MLIWGRIWQRGSSFFEPERAALCPNQATALIWVMRAQTAPIILSRARFVEDQLETATQHGLRQYVILGAGLDTFAFRRPDLLERIHVFELDHPAMQAYKYQRLAELGWKIPERLHLLPIDFTAEDLSTVLQHSVYDPHALSLYSWLGVTFYLTRDVILSTLRSIAHLNPAGSEIIFDYVDSDAFLPTRSTTRMQRLLEIVKHVGEPMITSFDPSTLARELANLGLRLEEGKSPADIEQQYFYERTDGYHAYEHFHLARAIVAQDRSTSFQPSREIPPSRRDSASLS